MPRIKKSTLALIESASAPGGITLADVMRTRVCTMREAIVRIHEAEATGRVVRSGGAPGTAFRWTAATLITPGATA